MRLCGLFWEMHWNRFITTDCPHCEGNSLCPSCPREFLAFCGTLVAKMGTAVIYKSHSSHQNLCLCSFKCPFLVSRKQIVLCVCNSLCPSCPREFLAFCGTLVAKMGTAVIYKSHSSHQNLCLCSFKCPFLVSRKQIVLCVCNSLCPSCPWECLAFCGTLVAKRRTADTSTLPPTKPLCVRVCAAVGKPAHTLSFNQCQFTHSYNRREVAKFHSIAMSQSPLASLVSWSVWILSAALHEGAVLPPEKLHHINIDMKKSFLLCKWELILKSGTLFFLHG